MSARKTRPSFFATLFTTLKGVLRRVGILSDPSEIAQYRELTAAERRGLGGVARSAVSRFVTKVTKRTPRISVRALQAARRGGVRRPASLLPRRRYAKPIPGETHRAQIPEFPWDEISKYYRRVKGRKIHLLIKGGSTGQTSSPTAQGSKWRSAGSTMDGDDLPYVVGLINNDPKGTILFAGFNAGHRPDSASIIIWKKKP